MAVDLKITYSPIGFNEPQQETIPKVRAYSIGEDGMLHIDFSLMPYRGVLIPLARIQKVEVGG